MFATIVRIIFILFLVLLSGCATTSARDTSAGFFSSMQSAYSGHYDKEVNAKDKELNVEREKKTALAQVVGQLKVTNRSFEKELALQKARTKKLTVEVNTLADEINTEKHEIKLAKNTLQKKELEKKKALLKKKEYELKIKSQRLKKEKSKKIMQGQKKEVKEAELAIAKSQIAFIETI